MKINILGAHNSESRNTRMVSIVIDGCLAIDAGSLTSELTYGEQSEIQAILLTHGHYDHIRAVPAFAFNNTARTTEVFALPQTLKVLSNNLMDGHIYPEFTSDRSYLGKSILKLVPVRSGELFSVGGYDILPVNVIHPEPSLGFQITDKTGKRLFHSGDTGPGLTEVWKKVDPDLIFIDMTFPDKMEATAIASGHLCPRLLKNELIDFKRLKGQIPEIMVFHLSAQFEEDIRHDLAQVSTELGISIGMAHEGAVKSIE